MLVCETERLIIRYFNLMDTDFIIDLLNQQSFIDNIADKGVRTKEDAQHYLENGPIVSYQKFGFGLSMVELKSSKVPIGMCGILKRDTLEHPDLGYAFLPEHCGKGYAVEAAEGIIKIATQEFNFKRIVAITTPDNDSSIRLLEKIGFEFETMIKLSADAPECKLFAFIPVIFGNAARHSIL